MTLGFSFRRVRHPETGQRILDDLRGILTDPQTRSSVCTDDGQAVITIVGDDGRTRTVTYSVSDAPRKVLTTRSIQLEAKCSSETDGRSWRRFGGVPNEQLS